MAQNQAAKIGYDDFEANQLPVDVLFVHNPDAFDLAKAVEIGLISDSARAAIEANMPNHNVLFKGALERNLEGAEGNEARKAAFRKACAIYRRFGMEDKDAGVRQLSARVLKKLNNHLKVGVPAGDHSDADPKKHVDGSRLQDRPALAAAMRRLQMREARGRAKGEAFNYAGEVNMTLPTLRAARDQAIVGRDEAVRLTSFVPGLDKRTDNSAIYAAMEREGMSLIVVPDSFSVAMGAPMMQNVRNGDLSGATLDARIQAANADLAQRDTLPAKFDAELTRVGGVWGLDYLDVMSEVSPVLRGSSGLNSTSDLNFLGTFNGAFSAFRNMSPKQLEDLSDFRKGELTPVLADIANLRTILPAGPLAALDKMVAHLEAFRDELDKTIEAQEKVRRGLASREAARDGLITTRDNWNTNYVLLDANFRELNMEPGTSITPDHLAKMPELGGLLNNYKAAYATFKSVAGDPTTATLDALQQMIHDYDMAMAAVQIAANKYLGGTRRTLAQEEAKLENAKNKLAGFDEVAAVDTTGLTPLELLDRAFGPDKSGKEMVGLERKATDAEANAKKARSTYKYFADSDNFDAVVDVSKEYIRSVGAYVHDDTKPFRERLNEAKANLSSAETGLSKLSEPSETEITRLIDAKIKNRKTGDPVIDVDTERDTILNSTKDRRSKYQADVAKYEAEAAELKLILEKGIDLQSKLEVLVKQIKAAQQLGVKFENGFDVFLIGMLDLLNVKGNKFHPMGLAQLAEKVNEYFGDDKKVADLQEAFDEKIAKEDKAAATAKKAYDMAKVAEKATMDLSDTAAAEKIIRAMVDEDYPGLSHEEKDEMVKAFLQEDVELMLNKDGYEAIAQRGSEEVLTTLKNTALQTILEARYKVGGSEAELEPLKGIRPEDLASIASVNAVFDQGRLNHKNGFFALAAMQKLETENVRSAQSGVMIVRLKKLLAEELGVEKRMHDSDVQKIVNKAFDKQLEKAKNTIDAYMDSRDANLGDFNVNKVIELNARAKAVKTKFRLGQIKKPTFDLEMGKIFEEVEKYELKDKIDFSTDAALSGYWNSKQAQWLRDLSGSVGKHAGKLAWAGTKGLVGAGAKGVFGATKMVAGSALSLTWGAGKSVLRNVARPFVGIVNLFRKKSNQLRPFDTIGNGVRNGIAAITGKMANMGNATVEGVKGSASDIAGKVGGVEFAWDHFKDKQENPDELKTRIDEAAKAGKIPAAVVAADPYIDLAEFKAEIAKLDKKPEEPKVAAAA